MVSEISATMAATRLTIDSAASDSRPTEPVMAQALPLSRTVSTAAAIASQAYFLKSGVVVTGPSLVFMWGIVACAHRPGEPQPVRGRLVRGAALRYIGK